MTETITIELPPGVARTRLESVLRELSAEGERREQLRLVLHSDAALTAFAQRRFGRPPLPLVRAGTYTRIDRCQEFEDFACDSEFRNDPRRPVLMRGSCAMLAEAHRLHNSTSGNGLCIALAERYIRRIKLTVFSREEMVEHPAWGALHRIKAKHFGSYYFFDYIADRGQWRDGAFINGRFVDGLSPRQLARLRELHAVRQKAAQLEERAA